VKFVISATGSVASSQVAQSSAGDAELETCVAGRVRTWQFPKPKGGGVVIVTYPFIFKQSGE
jgi:TonB family protein